MPLPAWPPQTATPAVGMPVHRTSEYLRPARTSPAVLEDRLRTRWLVSQRVIIGDARPYIGAMVTIDPGAVRPVEGRPRQAAGGDSGRPSRRSRFAGGDPGGHGRGQQGSISIRGDQEVHDPRRGFPVRRPRLLVSRFGDA